MLCSTCMLCAPEHVHMCIINILLITYQLSNAAVLFVMCTSLACLVIMITLRH